ncbi:MAG: DUF488 domain-containing protein [Syntrophorhabdaceae bacterium]|nr:DUF488 domain-containing protein [Syntrophorhabdaceae bacterium]
MKNNTIYTIGHSTHSIDQFIKILQAYKIELVADVRTIHRSRHNPQFNENQLKLDLEQHDIEYLHLEELGGLRHTTRTSVNTGWTNLSFRGFADYMQTPEFQKGIELLIETSKLKQTVIMCAEAVPWRCHRSLIGDALMVRSIEVEDIISEKIAKPHKITLWAKVNGVTITYPETVQ